MESIDANRPTRQQAISAMCRSCVYDPAAAGNWKQQVTLCAVADCPLFDYRPLSRTPIPEKLLDEYAVPAAERGLYRQTGGRRRPRVAMYGGGKGEVAGRRRTPRNDAKTRPGAAP